MLEALSAHEPSISGSTPDDLQNLELQNLAEAMLDYDGIPSNFTLDKLDTLIEVLSKGKITSSDPAPDDYSTIVAQEGWSSPHEDDPQETDESITLLNESWSSPYEDDTEYSDYTTNLLNGVSKRLHQNLHPSPRTVTWDPYYTLPDPTICFPLPLLPGTNLSTLGAAHTSQRLLWETSEPCRKSREMFQTVLNLTSSQPIHICMCLNLGSLSGDHSYTTWNPWSAPMARLVAFETWVHMIATHQKSEPLVIFQDPDFNDMDVEFLTSRGHIPIESPMSNDIVSENTFLFVPWNEDDHGRAVCATLRKAFPALLLGFDADKDRVRKGPVRRLLGRFVGQREWVELAVSADSVA